MGDRDPHYQEGAADRAHGTHGKGDAREQRQDDAVIDNSGGKTGLAEPGWGSEASGGSSVDKRSDKHRGSGGT